MTTENITIEKECVWCGEALSNRENGYIEKDAMPNKILFEVHTIMEDETTEKGLCCNDCIASWMCECPEDFELISIRKYEGK